MTRTAESDREDIDWRLTTWDGARREQLRRWAALPLDRVVLALEEMQVLAHWLARPSTADPQVHALRALPPAGKP